VHRPQHREVIAICLQILLTDTEDGGPLLLIGAVVCLLPALWVQLTVSVGNECQHNTGIPLSRLHSILWLFPISQVTYWLQDDESVSSWQSAATSKAV